MPTLDIAPAEMKKYIATARRRREQQRRALEDRRTRARRLAKRASALLKSEYGAYKVILYGSLARGRGFHERSDVDLAAWGLPEREYYRIVSRLLDLDPSIETNVVMGEMATSSLLESIECEGMEL